MRLTAPELAVIAKSSVRDSAKDTAPCSRMVDESKVHTNSDCQKGTKMSNRKSTKPLNLSLEGPLHNKSQNKETQIKKKNFGEQDPTAARTKTPVSPAPVTSELNFPHLKKQISFFPLHSFRSPGRQGVDKRSCELSADGLGPHHIVLIGREKNIPRKHRR